MEEITKAIVFVVGVIFVAALLGLLISFPIMWCWNYAVVSIWGLPVITWGKAWCLGFLAQCFIKSSLTTTKS